VNFELTVIEDGAEALAFVEGEGPVPDLAVLDLNLPKHDGVQVLGAIRASRRFARTPVVIASSSAQAPAFIRTEDSRVAHYFMKPPDLAEFLQVGPILKELPREAARAR
jgi:CheY-like chemotaxis protein